jgi:hypothetical protein
MPNEGVTSRPCDEQLRALRRAFPQPLSARAEIERESPELLAGEETCSHS